MEPTPHGEWTMTTQASMKCPNCDGAGIEWSGEDFDDQSFECQNCHCDFTARIGDTGEIEYCHPHFFLFPEDFEEVDETSH